MVHEDSISSFLKRAETQFKLSPVSDLTPEWGRLRRQLDEPCEVAIAGAVKRGKSTLLNALLGADLAQTGSSETTATINYFRFGEPDPAKPVKCYWRNGTVTAESRQFIDELQGNDLAILRRAEGIEKLEFTLSHEFLRDVTLVDTPGTGAVVDEHENRTAEYLQLTSRLRERHDAETRRIGGSADAIIYALDVVGKDDDRRFLEEFQSVGKPGQMGPYNSVGVVTKIDLNPDALRDREAVRLRIGTQFKEVVSAVVTVSGGVQRKLDVMLADARRGLHRFFELLRKIPPDMLVMLLQNERMASRLPLPLSDIERAELLPERDWQVFVTLAKTAVATDYDAEVFIQKTREIAGFDPLRQLLQRQFLERGRHLRWRRVVQNAMKILDDVRYMRIRELREQERLRKDKLLRYQRLLETCRDRVIADELRTDLEKWLSVGDEERVRKLCDSLAGECSSLLRELGEINDDYETLKLLRDDAAQWSQYELEELDMVLGRYGLDDKKRVPEGKLTQSYVSERMMAWQVIETISPIGSVRKIVASRARTQYGNLLSHLINL